MCLDDFFSEGVNFTNVFFSICCADQLLCKQQFFFSHSNTLLHVRHTNTETHASRCGGCERDKKGPITLDSGRSVYAVFSPVFLCATNISWI